MSLPLGFATQARLLVRQTVPIQLAEISHNSGRLIFCKPLGQDKVYVIQHSSTFQMSDFKLDLAPSGCYKY